MNSALPAQVESLFTRCPALCGFSVRSSENDGELFIGDIGVSLPLTREQFDEISREIVAALAELLAEEPEAGEILRGRTFARVLH